MVEILYIPGLNTYADGQIHVGPFRFGSMHSKIAAALLKRDVRLVLYDEKTASTAKTNVILAHSSGGLTARALAHQVDFSHIRRIITVATPHMGTPLAERALEIELRNNLLSKLLRVMGYNLKDRLSDFEKLVPQALQTFNHKYPDKDVVTYYSVLAAPKASDLELPFRLLKKIAGLKFGPNDRFDGIIPYESQKWGVPLGNFELDHLAQIGFYRHILSKRRRKMAKLQFEEMIALIASVAKMSR